MCFHKSFNSVTLTDECLCSCFNILIGYWFQMIVVWCETDCSIVWLWLWNIFITITGKCSSSSRSSILTKHLDTHILLCLARPVFCLALDLSPLFLSAVISLKFPVSLLTNFQLGRTQTNPVNRVCIAQFCVCWLKTLTFFLCWPWNHNIIDTKHNDTKYAKYKHNIKRKKTLTKTEIGKYT